MKKNIFLKSNWNRLKAQPTKLSQQQSVALINVESLYRKTEKLSL